MGLDMYLRASRYLWWSFNENGSDAQKRNKIQKMFPELGAPSKKYGDRAFEVTTVEAKVGYWRKANAIHKWFVDNVQYGIDDCGRYSVEWEDLEKLRSLCQSVIDNPDSADVVLPSASGFFFGGTQYDEWYFVSLKETVEIIDCIDKQLITEKFDDGTRYSKWNFYYQSTW